MKDQHQKIALITGANKGIGWEIARQWGRLGYTALLGARDVNRGKAAAQRLRDEGIDAHFVLLDVTDAETIDRAVASIQARFGRLDALVNNAAIAIDNAPPSLTDLETLRRTYETNVFGLFAVTRAMLPLLQKSEAGRIVNMSSGAGSLTETSKPDWRAEWVSLPIAPLKRR